LAQRVWDRKKLGLAVLGVHLIWQEKARIGQG